METRSKGGHMRIGDLLFNSDKIYLVKSFLPRSAKRVWLLELDTGDEFSILKSIARHWKTVAKEDI